MLWIAFLFAAGILTASVVTVSAYVWLGMALAVLMVAFALRHPKLLLTHLSARFMIAAFFFIGAGWYQFRQPVIDAFHIAFYNDRAYEMLATGTLAEPPDVRDTYINLRVQVYALDTGSGDLPVSGLMLARIQPNQEYEYGQRVRLRGLLKTPPENEEFSYRDYLARDGVYSYMSSAEVTVLPGSGGSPLMAAVYALKLKLLENTHRLFNDPEASLLAGILLGVDTGLTRSLQDAFKNTGTAHIIAISGFNIAIIAGIFFSMFKTLLGERLGAAAAVAGIAFYTVLVGADSAVVRAALMGSISLFARQVGRRNSGLNALAVVAFLMTIFNPFVLWDVGFQLSFFATLGLILYAEPFSSFTGNLISKLSKQDNSRLTQIINDNVVLTFAAQLTTIPIMAYHFKRISLISFLANPFILPVQPLVMIVGGLAVFTSLVAQPIGQLIAWVAWPFTAYTIRMVELFNQVPHGTIFLGDSSLWLVTAFYAALLTATFNWGRITDWFKSLAGSLRAAALTAALVLMFSCAVLVWRSTSTAGDGQMHITFLNAGSADAVLIQTPEGRNILINGGESTSELADELGRRLPLFSRKLDWLVIASTQENQVAALPRVVERYPAENVLWSGNIQASFSAQTLDKYFAEHQVPVTRAEAGQRLDLGSGAYLEVQTAGPRGSVLLIQYANFRALLPIGLSNGMLEELEFGNTIGNVDVMLLADSGFEAYNPPDIIENVNPKLVVLSVAAGDPAGLPAQPVLESLDGYSLLRTDRNGWISVSTNGDSMQVAVERGEPTEP